MNLLDECARRVAEREDAEWGEGTTDLAQAKKWVAPIVADVLDILTAEGRVSPPVPPGLCWAASAPIVWPGHEPAVARCELLAGHAGAHATADRSHVWIETATTAAVAVDGSDEG